MSAAEARARLFFALWPSPPLAAALASWAGQFAAVCGGRPMRPETIHLTLAFLGDVELAGLDRLLEIAAAVRTPAFDLRIERAGYWPHNRIVWAGVAASPSLQQLAASLHAGLRGQNTAVDRENRPFFPHLTLLRKAAAAELPGLPDLPLWSCDEFVLVRSLHEGGSAAYECLYRLPLERAQT